MNRTGNKYFYIGVILVFLGIFCLYIFTLTKNWSDDAIAYAFMVKHADSIFSRELYQPHHLLYHAAGFLMHNTVIAFSRSYDTTSILQVFNCVLAILTLGAFFVFLRSIGVNQSISLLLCLGLSGTYSFWICATDIEPQLSPQVFHILILIFLTRINKTRFPYSVSIAIGLLHGLAILFYQSSALFIIPAIIGLFLFSNHAKRYSCILLYILSSTLTAASIYIMAAVFILNIKTIKEFFIFVTYYHHLHISGIRFFEALNIPRVLYMLCKIILYMPLSTLRDFLKGIFSFNGFLNIIAVLLTTFAYIFFFALSRKIKLNLIQKKVATVAVCWLTVYLLYIAAGEAAYFVPHYINVVLPFWILLAPLADNLLLLAKNKSRFYISFCIAILWIFIWNYSLFAISSTAIDNNARYKNALFWKKNSLPQDVFLFFSWSPYFEYFANKKVINLRDFFPDLEKDLQLSHKKLHKVIKAELKRGANVYLLGLDIVLTSKHVQNYMPKTSRTYTVDNIKSFFSKYKMIPIKTEFGKVFRVSLNEG